MPGAADADRVPGARGAGRTRRRPPSLARCSTGRARARSRSTFASGVTAVRPTAADEDNRAYAAISERGTRAACSSCPCARPTGKRRASTSTTRCRRRASDPPATPRSRRRRRSACSRAATVPDVRHLSDLGVRLLAVHGRARAAFRPAARAGRADRALRGLHPRSLVGPWSSTLHLRPAPARPARPRVRDEELEELQRAPRVPRRDARTGLLLAQALRGSGGRDEAWSLHLPDRPRGDAPARRAGSVCASRAHGRRGHDLADAKGELG